MSARSVDAQRDLDDHNDRLKCNTCSRVFTRQEHLRRHELTHSDDKRFKCMSCGRDFVRKDALDRHEATHQTTGPTLRQKGARACTNCATAKSRCSGELPICSRCRKRGEAQCTYPDSSVLFNATFDGNEIVVPAQTRSTPQPLPVQDRIGHQDALASNPDILPMADLAESLDVNQFDAGFWGNDLSSTINWLSEDVSAIDTNYQFEHFDDNILFPSYGTPFVRDAVINGSIGPVLPPVFSPQQPSHISLSSNDTPHSMNSHTTIEKHVDGELYVDGQPARLPRVKRRKLTASSLVLTPTQADRYDLALDHAELEAELSNPAFTLSVTTYNELVYAFRNICMHDQTHTVENDTTTHHSTSGIPHTLFARDYEPTFPSKDRFEMLVTAFITSFLSILPIIHSTNLQDMDWQLVLAASALGVHFVKFELPNKYFVSSIHEFLRRVLYIGGEVRAWLPKSNTAKVQLRLLYAISMAYSLPNQSITTPRSTDYLPIDYCLTLWKSRSQRPEPVNYNSVIDRWQQWIGNETSIRLGYAIWLVDSMFAIHFQQRPILALEDASSNLPCCEKVWQAYSADEWFQLHSASSRTTSLKATLYELYTQKQLNADTGEFSRTLLIHGLFHRMWEVEDYFKDPLSQWTPTAQKSAERLPQADTNIWLPSLPTFARWRNSSCDCVDVLHWSANATIGVASGIEHPTVLHLHFSRVVLLTPYKHIVAVARYVASTESRISDKEIAVDKHMIKRWAVQDQYKARLAMIHAAVLFWHVRRYSVNGFYEPSSVAMSALALWAFSVFSEGAHPTERSASRSSGANQDSSENEEARCDIILLDRPTDDELVQQYVREGHKMRAILNGVGDLCGANAPARVLVEGRKLLRTLTTWGVAGQWIALFDRLITISRRQHDISVGESG